MAKRFTDTEKYKKIFIRNLPAAYKIFWDYLYHDCNHAGIWQADFEIAQIYIGKDAPIKKDDALSLFNADEERIIVLDGGTKWFIKPFIEFQYGQLNPSNKAHLSVINILDKYKIKPLASPLHEAMDMDMDKDMDKDKDKDKKKRKKYLQHDDVKEYRFNVFIREQDFNKLIQDYGVENTNKLLDKLSISKEAKGYKYDNDYMAILNWVVEALKLNKKPKPQKYDYSKKECF